MDTLVGKWLGRYHIIKEIGEGGMGIIYIAEDSMFDRIVALKVIHPQLRSSPKFFERFRREALSLARLEHTNIVKLLDFGEQEDIAYLVMPYLTAGTLADRMGAPVPYPIAAELLLPIARALEHAHQRKIVHRDIKPTNIIFDESGQPMVTDFGLTKILEEDSLQSITSAGVGVGTPEYMSPEQGLGQPIDYATDIYALGVVFYELVTGHKPFEGESAAEILNQHVSTTPPSPTDWVPNLPERVVWALDKALAKKPADRFESMEAFAQTLERFSAEEEGFSSETLTAVSADRLIEESTTRVDSPEPVIYLADASGTEEHHVQETLVQSKPLPPQPKMRQPARLTWIGGCLIGGIILICCLLSLAAAAAGAYWVPIAKEEGSLSFLATETRRPSPTRRPTRTVQGTPEVVVITEAPVSTEALVSTEAPMPTVVVEEEPAGPVDLELWTTESGDSLTLLQEIASSFNQQNPDITIQITNIGYSDFTPMLETVFAAGDPPEMILYAAPSMRKYVENGLLYPAGSLVDTTQYFPSLVDQVTMNDEVWGVPLSTTGQLVLFYNKDLVESPPQNTLQFIDTAKKHGLSYYHRVWFFDFPWLGAFSGSVRNGDSPIPQLNSNAMVQTLQFILDLTDKHGILPAVTEYGQGDNEFLSGQTGMAINGSWSYTYYKDSLGDSLGVAPLPNMTTTGRSPSVLVYGLYFFIPNQGTGQNSLNAMSDFIQYATNYENQIQLAQRLNYLPALKTTSGDQAILNNPILTTMLMQLPKGTPEWIGMNWGCIYSSADPAIAAMLDGAITPKQAAEQMQAEVEICIANEQ